MSDLTESIEETAEAIFDVIESPQSWVSARPGQRDLYRRAACRAIERRSGFPMAPDVVRTALTKLALTDTEEIPTKVAVDRCLAEMGVK